MLSLELIHANVALFDPICLSLYKYCNIITMLTLDTVRTDRASPWANNHADMNVPHLLQMNHMAKVSIAGVAYSYRVASG